MLRLFSGFALHDGDAFHEPIDGEDFFRREGLAFFHAQSAFVVVDRAYEHAKGTVQNGGTGRFHGFRSAFSHVLGQRQL